MKTLKSFQIANSALKALLFFCFIHLFTFLKAQTYTHDQNLTHTAGTFILNTPTKHFDNLSVGIDGGFYLGSKNGAGLPGSMGWQTIQDQTTGSWFFRNSNRAMLWEFGHWNQMWTLKMSNNSPTPLVQ